MEDVLSLLDTELTGFVTWEAFARVLLSVASQSLLREDVVKFLDKYCKIGGKYNDQNLVDYREFLISGKVLILKQFAFDYELLPTTAWLERQRLLSGIVEIEL
jgi:hypothetical protein